jgi:rhodanese-related sulfurtransferase
VREPAEHSAASIAGAVLIPMREIPARLTELDRDTEIVVFCHHGSRSAMVVQFLRAQGFEKAINMAGGIDAWSIEVDPGVPRYR